MAGEEGLTTDEGTSLESPDTALQHTDLPDDDADIESSTQEIEVQGRRAQVVPAGALSKERKARRAAAAKAKDAETQLAEATGRITRLEGDIAQFTPIADAIRRRPDLMAEALGQTQPSTRQSTAGREGEVSDATAREIAEQYELFDQQGQPDLSRGRRAALQMRDMVRSMVDESVRPLRNATIADKAASNKATLAAYVKQGDITQRSAEAVLGMVPDELLADPKVMSVLYYTALGIDAAQGKAGKRAAAGETGREAPSSPIHTESGGRRPGAGAVLSDFEETVAKNRGMSTQQYRDALKDLPEYGSPITLE
jgi:hypothetical protein